MYAIPQPIEHHLNVQTTSIYWFHSCLNAISVTLPLIGQLDIQMTSILLLSSLIWFMSPCKPLPSLTFRQLPYYCFHRLYYFLNPATYWPVERSGDFYIINSFFHPLLPYPFFQPYNILTGPLSLGFIWFLLSYFQPSHFQITRSSQPTLFTYLLIAFSYANVRVSVTLVLNTSYSVGSI